MADGAAVLGALTALILATIGTAFASGALDPGPPRSAPPAGMTAALAQVALAHDARTVPPTTEAPLAAPSSSGPAADDERCASTVLGPAPVEPPPGAGDRRAGVPRPVAAFLGDSYTTGWAGSGIGPAGWPRIVGSERAWRVVNRAVAGTGFVNAGWTGQPIRTQVAAVVKANPGIVFVAGGHNDRRYGATATARAAAPVLARLRRELPDAVIVVIGPIWQSGTPPRAVLGIRDRLRAEAEEIGALFVDPLRDGWFAGRAGRLILADGIHPSNAGHRRIASLVLDALEADPRTSAGAAHPTAAPAVGPETLRTATACAH